VLYRTLWNENIVFRPKPSDQATALTSDKLQSLTYMMSYTYATATKSPRLVPVLLYSSRLAKGNSFFLFKGTAAKTNFSFLIVPIVAMGYKDCIISHPHCGRRFVENEEPGISPNFFGHKTRDGEQEISDARVLPQFSPSSDSRIEDGTKWRIPFRPHLSA